MNQRAQVTSPSVGCQIRIATAGIPQWIQLTADIRITELNPIDIRANYQNFPIRGGRGLYDPQIGKIILCQGEWCRETLIHESLHSLSFSSVRMDLRRTLLSIFEGLTEFFTGYVMFKLYLECYDAWKASQYSFCSVTYAPSVKLWSAFCRFIPISELVKIYFWNGTSDWEASYDIFLSTIREAGYSRFDDFVRHPVPTVEGRLLDECLKNFGREKFRSLYEAPLQTVLDFTQMLCSSLPVS